MPSGACPVFSRVTTIPGHATRVVWIDMGSPRSHRDISPSGADLVGASRPGICVSLGADTGEPDEGSSSAAGPRASSDPGPACGSVHSVEFQASRAINSGGPRAKIYVFAVKIMLRGQA